MVLRSEVGTWFTRQPGERTPLGKLVGNYLLVVVIVVGVFWLSLYGAGVTLNFSFVTEYRTRLLDGFVLTLWICLGSLVLSMVIGIPVALAARSNILPLRYAADFYVKIIRGTPLLVQIYLFYYIIGTAWGVNNKTLSGILILSVFTGSYVAEIIRGSAASLDQTQLLAADAVGFTRVQSVRYVILPQMVARTLPALTGQLASLIKDSSLLSVIAVIEITQTIREITATNYNFFGGYIFLGAIYLCLTLPLMFVSSHFERKFAYDH
ncbi:amino acid ABC transporter permease [Actinomyces minihominis]|uniref:amino acid ABC transporter permease n=1 Tax=Actinomyces minihominis TaxID=2002838 RepID=UPI001A92025F|nr:amino acid ABC transporter permease [Actinomyces minihominis]